MDGKGSYKSEQESPTTSALGVCQEKDDPCYGCRFAVKKTVLELDNDAGFARRFLCANRNRIAPIENRAIRELANHEYSKAAATIARLIQMTRHGCFKLECKVGAVRPVCWMEGKKHLQKEEGMR